MISKERLEELIEQGATIYDIFKGDIYLVDLTMAKYYDVPKYIEYKNDYYNCNLTRSINDLFETEEDARWELEMTATRTETLKLVNWEQFCYEENETRFTDKLDNRCSISYETELLGDNYIAVYQNHFTLFRESATKENYTKACELCIKLFKGEEV